MAPNNSGDGAAPAPSPAPAPADAGWTPSKRKPDAAHVTRLATLNPRRLQQTRGTGDPTKSEECVRAQIISEMRGFKSYSQPYSQSSPKKLTADEVLQKYTMKTTGLSKAASQPDIGGLPSLDGAEEFSSPARARRCGLLSGQPVQILGMTHRPELEGMHAHVLDPEVDHENRVRVRLPGNSDSQEEKVMRIMVDRLLPKLPTHGRPDRLTEATWFGHTVRVAPVAGKRKPVPTYLDDLHRQCLISEKAHREGATPSPMPRAFSRNRTGQFFKHVEL
jgi:hypothetical protein